MTTTEIKMSFLVMGRAAIGEKQKKMKNSAATPARELQMYL
jgi:hypothetical protein